MDVTKNKLPEFPFLAGGGVLGKITRDIDWGKSSLGTPDTWPLSLKTTVGIVLHSAFPMFLFWGPEHICFYNDAFMPSLGTDGKHPAVGKQGREVWRDAWDQIWPWISEVMETGNPVFFEDKLVPFYRNGQTEEIYWTFSYGPAYDDDGAINGVLVNCFETTEKVRSLAKTEATKRQFEHLVRDATAGIVVLIGQEKRVEIVNEAYAKLIGRSVKELLGKCLWDVIPEAQPEFDGLLEKVRLTGDPIYLYNHPYSVNAGADKIDGYLNIIYQPYREEDGTITGIMALCHDVTGQITDNRKLQESEQKIRAMVEAAPFPIGVYTGKEMCIELANRAMMDVWGKGDDVIGKSYKAILPELTSQHIFEQMDEVYDTGIPFHARGQKVDLIVNGTLQAHYFNYSFLPLYDADGKVYGIMNTGAEVTDLHLAKQKVEQSEKNLRNIVLQAPVAMSILLGDNLIIDVANDMMLKMWGRERDSVVGKPRFESIPEATDPGLEQVMKHIYKSGEPFTATEHPMPLLRNSQRETVYQNLVYQPYRDSDGKILGVLTIAVDVTQHVLARQKIEELVALRTKELAEANESLRKSNDELAQFAYIASHDLQEPVRKVSIFVQLLEKELTENGQRKGHFIEKIKHSTARMLSLIRDVLAYSQLSQQQPGFVSVNLQDTMREAINDYELIIEQKQATVSYANLPTVNAIPLQMSQLFGNLLSNSLKFSTTDKPPVISVSSEPLQDRDLVSKFDLESGKHYHYIRFTDNGVGFNPGYADKIFNIFQRLHDKNAFEGTGIGLATCRKIVQNHGGHIYATSEIGAGATFHIIFPK